MIQIKNIEYYTNSEGRHLVCRGRLVLVPSKSGLLLKKYDDIKLNFNSFPTDSYNPIIVSEAETIISGDKISDGRGIYTAPNLDGFIGLFKVIANPAQMSPEILVKIIEGKLKAMETVFVECIHQPPEYEIKCNASTVNHIKIFPITNSNEILLMEDDEPIIQQETWEEIFDKQIDLEPDNSHPQDGWRLLSSFLKENYHPPVKK